MESGLLLQLLAVLLIAVGLAGLALPAIPGAPVLFAGLLLSAWAEDFQYVALGTLTALAALAVLTYAVDFAAGAFGAKHFGASGRAAVGAVIGAVGGIVFGLPGIILGPFVGAFIGELSARRSVEEAGRAGIGATLGLVAGAALKLALGISMVGIYAWMRFG
jgi:uncharacterized protein YqgC (DUF456 family)